MNIILTRQFNEGKIRIKLEYLSVIYFILILILTFSYRARPTNLNMEPCMAGPSVCSPLLWLTASFVPSLRLLVSS